ncbi:hypothetical protein BV22DRAFT_999811 [Leucogyrophana mollusca]|uniref:Uncharacterized protein n=1 Tax=Leucogyrophana mollusca TaxID=85980 RepID=A0ACB8BZ35_9AGAM|nr:hypothetical protein BV22DRAFT_999811 [Leucogyrophana mollusca]
MSQQTPIVLWNPRRHTSHATDDAGTSIKKSVLAPPVPPPPYTLSQPSQSHRVVPPLAYFCIRALSAYPDQLHVLGHIRIPYRPDILRALIPCCNGSTGGEARDMAEHGRLCLQAVDPRLWATIAQVMHPLPYSLRDLDLPLADLHLPLLQQIPSTPHFSLVTLLSLPCCKELCDETISALRKLNSLVALDLRGTPVSSYGVNVLARGLSWDRSEGRASRVGPWGLRILRLHSCRKVDNGVFSALHKFPLLSAVGRFIFRSDLHFVS